MSDDPKPETSSSKSGAKRPASEEITEPADAKSKTKVPKRNPPTTEPDGKMPNNPGGILNLIANRFSTPFPTHDAVFSIINTADMVHFYGHMWDALIEAIYPDGNFLAANVITQANFALVCRYLTKSRIDHVYSSYSGRRAAHRIAIPREFEIPKSLADVINGIGTILVQSGALMLCPQPEVAAADAAGNLVNQVTYAMLTAFSRLIQAAKVRGIIRTSYISATVEGTAWWILSARERVNPALIADDQDSVCIFAIFKEWTPADGIISGIVQRGANGLVGGDTEFKWSMDAITGIAGLRRSFCLDA